MPDYFTHIAGARQIYARLEARYRNPICDDTLYLLGAQGGDAFFFYGMSYRHNAGRFLHRQPATWVFERLAQKDKSYCAGWAAHYALDSTIHPHVYAYEHTHRGMFLHRRYETDLGLYVTRKSGARRLIIPKDKLLACTPAVCDSMRPLLPEITPAGVQACLKRYFLYSRSLFNSKSQEFALACDYSAAYAAYLEAIDLGAEMVRRVLDGDIDPDIFKKSFIEGAEK